MCGIYGKIEFKRDINIAECFRRTQMLNHRGPDHIGKYVSMNAYLGHARLSILDLSAAANQPFGDSEARLVFNGEIYNWQELRRVHLPECALTTNSDTEVLYLLLRKMGLACLPLLNGMFALAYYTSSTRTLILARDTVGIKPLNFIVNESFLEFSSEIKNMEYIPDLNRLKEYLYFGRFGEDFLPYANVNEVLPGSFVSMDCETGRWFQQPYREIESIISQEKYNQLLCSRNLVDQLDELLQRSVAIHEQSDAPIGFLCSGGLDSSLITAIAAKRRKNMALYHADFEGDGRELEHAATVAQYVGAPLRLTTLTKDQFWAHFPEMTYSIDLPIQHPHSVSLNTIARKAREDGVKVLLAGDGADELFMGYDFYSSYASSLSNFRSSSDLRTILRKANNGIRRLTNRASDPYWFFSNINRSFQKHAHVGFGGDATSLANPVQAMSLISQDFKAWKRWQQAEKALAWMGESREASVLSFQLFHMRYFLQPLLHRLDRMLMNPSVEGRVPFLENEVINFSLNLPVGKKICGNRAKHLLKEVALRYLPPKIVDRRKMGFTVPCKKYITKFPAILNDGFVSEWTGLSKEELESWCNQDKDQIYKLISIEVWGQIFVHKTPWQSIRVDA